MQSGKEVKKLEFSWVKKSPVYRILYFHVSYKNDITRECNIE